MPAANNPSSSSTSTYTSKELFQYTTTSCHKCWIRDIYALKPYDDRGEIYMLGRVPCRNVEVVGICVGVSEKEKQTMIAVDDGTGVIECVYRKLPPSPTKKKTPSKLVAVALVGWPLRIIGKVTQWREREIRVNTIERVDYNEEPRHWKRVRTLHETEYDLKEPFIIPPIVRPSSPQRKAETQRRDVPSSSPATTTSDTQKLRHPSRLHTQQLTDNTFRLYVQHYLKSLTSTQKGKRPRRGCTLAYLRRVAELCELAKRVVKATAKRKDEEGKKKDPTHKRHKLTKVELGQKMKRLFQWAVTQLNRDGDLIIWSGALQESVEMELPWKTQSVDLSTMTAVSIIQDEDGMELSDAEESEEAYVSTDEYLVDELTEQVKIMPGLEDRNVVMARDILKRLKRDDRWQFIGEWHVEEALKRVPTVYSVRGGWRFRE